MIALPLPGLSPAAVSTVTVVAIEAGVAASVADGEETVALVAGRADPVAEDASKAAVSQNNAN